MGVEVLMMQSQNLASFTFTEQLRKKSVCKCTCMSVYYTTPSCSSTCPGTLTGAYWSENNTHFLATTASQPARDTIYCISIEHRYVQNPVVLREGGDSFSFTSQKHDQWHKHILRIFSISKFGALVVPKYVDCMLTLNIFLHWTAKNYFSNYFKMHHKPQISINNVWHAL